MTEDHHFKWSSEAVCIRLYLGLNPRPLCSKVCYPLGHSGRLFSILKPFSEVFLVSRGLVSKLMVSDQYDVQGPLNQQIGRFVAKTQHKPEVIVVKIKMLLKTSMLFR